MPFHEQDRAGLRRVRSGEAITLAMEGRWKEAASVNREILERFPTDVDTCNRLGRALMELGEYGEAKESYGRSLKLDPDNIIARKNLDRLSILSDTPDHSKSDYHRVVPQLFIREKGKVGIVNLDHLASKETLAKIASGAEVYLKIKGQDLVVENSNEEYLGTVEPKQGLRLVKLLEGGNKYTSAIASLGENGVKVIIKEIFQHPTQVGRLSFPLKSAKEFQPYTRDSLLRYQVEADEGIEDPDLEEEGEILPEGFSLVEGTLSQGDEDMLEKE